MLAMDFKDDCLHVGDFVIFAMGTQLMTGIVDGIEGDEVVLSFIDGATGRDKYTRRFSGDVVIC